MSQGPPGHVPNRAQRGLAALLAAAGLFQIAEWLHKGVQQVRRRRGTAPLPPGAGEIRLDTGGERWNLIADLPAEPGSMCWLLVEGPRHQVAVAAASQPGAPLAFALEPGPPGTYRFWVFASRRRRETTRSLSKKIARALASGEFHVAAES